MHPGPGTGAPRGADRVVDGVAEKAAAINRHQDFERTRRSRERAGGEEQRVAGQERRDDQAGLGEDDGEENAVGPAAGGIRTIPETFVDVEEEINHLLVVPARRSATRSRLVPAVAAPVVRPPRAQSRVERGRAEVGTVPRGRRMPRRSTRAVDALARPGRGGAAARDAGRARDVPARRPRPDQDAAVQRGVAAPRPPRRPVPARQCPGRRREPLLPRMAVAIRGLRSAGVVGAVTLRLGADGEAYDGIRKDTVHVPGG